MAYTSLYDLFSEPQIVLYFAVLLWSAIGCARRSERVLPLAAAAATLSVTWAYIVRYTVAYEGPNLFDDAYKDVLAPPHFGTSAQLLTWVVVAAVWARDASPCYMLFGELGAMSAAFMTWIPLGAPSKRRVPLSVAATSALALVAIAHLASADAEWAEPALSPPARPWPLAHLWRPPPPPPLPSGPVFGADFGSWLQLLHLLLLLPMLLVRLFPAQPSLEAAPFYLALGLAAATWHRLGQPGPAYAWPATDCQLSISIDLALCALLTLLAVHLKGRSLARTSVAALALPLLSPASVLALHLASEQLPAFHAAMVTRLQRAVAARLRGASAQASTRSCVAPPPRWSNLGLFETADMPYDKACASLARFLADSVGLVADDRVLACGCGAGDELYLYKAEYSLRHVTGVDADPATAAGFTQDYNMRLLHRPAAALRDAFQPGIFNRLLALDAVYHFDDKRAFFAAAAALLPPGGTVGATDILVAADAPGWLRLALLAMNIPACNHWSAAQYEAELAALGLEGVAIVSTGARVLPYWLPKAMLPYLDYASVVARVPLTAAAPPHAPHVSPPRRRRKVAVIGSGLAGLATAHTLISSGRVDVTVFESRGKAGLGGDAQRFGEGKDDEAVVDVPLRMIGRGYYSAVESLANELGIPTVAASVDCCFYGVDARGGSRLFVLSRSYLKTALSLLPHLPEILRFRRSVGEGERDSETFGEWLCRRGHRSVPGTAQSGSDMDTGTEKGAGTGTGTDSVGVWVTMGQMSWVLSCTYEQVLGYPARIVLDFARGLGLGLRGMLTTNNVVRIHPSVEALQIALSYGATLVYGVRVGGVDERRVILDTQYDAVVVATEALAVRHVLAKADPVFAEVPYQASSIVLHHDESFMPPCKQDWSTLNVEQQPSSDMSQLTVWLNQYYPGVPFSRPTFETWNPLRTPEHAQKQVYFQRAVHTADTPRVLAAIDAAQGQHGIYYAGAYCVYGMGLLEQAAVSGVAAARHVLRDLSLAAPDAAPASEGDAATKSGAHDANHNGASSGDRGAHNGA